MKAIKPIKNPASLFGLDSERPHTLNSLNAQLKINGIEIVTFNLTGGYDPHIEFHPTVLPMRRDEVPRWRLDIVMDSETFQNIFGSYVIGNSITLHLVDLAKRQAWSGEAFPAEAFQNDPLDESILLPSSWYVFKKTDAEVMTAAHS